ncbi:MAG TPA: RNA polymerase sigma factor [Polyangia bacterium]|nr:RNA polymerase sigma factor [Polyangia bacterium]
MDRSTNQNKDDTFKERLVALYPQLFGLALRLCRNDADAHDLAQAAFERGLRYRDLFRSGESPDRWMSTILRRIFVDDYRTRQRRARTSLLDGHNAVTATEPEAPPAWEDFTFADVQRALLFVDRVSREIFSLFVFGQLAQDEIARRLSMSPKTVATRVFRTRAKLRKILESGTYRRNLALVPPATDPISQVPAKVPTPRSFLKMSSGRFIATLG